MQRWNCILQQLTHARQVLAAANLNGLKIDIVPDFQTGKTNKTPEFLAKFPTGKVPAFEGADGLNLLESDAILQYVAESGPKAAQLVGSTPAERARIQYWVLYQMGAPWEEVLKLLYPRLGFKPFDAAAEDEALANLAKVLGLVEGALEDGRQWLASTERLSNADLAVMSVLTWAFKFGVDEEMRSKFPKTMEWFLRTIRADGVKEAFGEPDMVAVRQIPA